MSFPRGLGFDIEADGEVRLDAFLFGEAQSRVVVSVKGMSAACIKFQTPVTGGNVSFYNQSVINGVEEPVFPTPTIGMLGVLEDKNKMMTLDFKKKGDLIFLLGESVNDIASSEYLYSSPRD